MPQSLPLLHIPWHLSWFCTHCWWNHCMGVFTVATKIMAPPPICYVPWSLTSMIYCYGLAESYWFACTWRWLLDGWWHIWGAILHHCRIALWPWIGSRWGLPRQPILWNSPTGHSTERCSQFCLPWLCLFLVGVTSFPPGRRTVCPKNMRVCSIGGVCTGTPEGLGVGTCGELRRNNWAWKFPLLC